MKKIIPILLLLILPTGCNVFLPKHENSEDLKGEKVRLKMLTKNDIETSYKDSYRSAFGSMTACSRSYIQEKPGIMPEAQTVAPIIGSVATAAVGLGIDYIKSALQKEAGKYETQFGNTRFVDDFYLVSEDAKRTEYKGKYCGFEIVRQTNKHNTYPAFKAIYGMAATNNQFLYKVAPLYFKTQSTKAKVLSTKWYSYLIPPFFWPLLLNDGDEIKTTIDLEVTTYALAENGAFSSEKVGSFSHSVGNYDISKSQEMRANGEGENALDAQILGIVYVAPEFKTNEKTSGILSIKALVTEKDPSNAKDQVEKLGELVGQQKDKVVKYVGKAFGNTTSATK